MKHLRHDVDHQIKQVAAGLAPVQRLVLVQGVQSEIPVNIFIVSMFEKVRCGKHVTHKSQIRN